MLREKAMTWVKRWYAQDGEGSALRIWKAWAERSALRYARVKSLLTSWSVILRLSILLLLLIILID